MTRDRLLLTAKALQQPGEEAAAEFERRQDHIAAELNRRMGARPDLDRLIGTDNQPMMEDNSRNFTLFMVSLFRRYEPDVLVETAIWAMGTYRAHGFQTTYWPANLDTYVEILKSELSAETFDAVAPFFHWLIINLPTLVKLTDEQLEAADS